MPNIGGPWPARRKLLSTVVDSIQLYGASTWAARVLPADVDRHMGSVQRKIYTYYQRMAVGLKGRRKCIGRSTTSETEATKDGRWTYELIPRLREWVLRRYGVVDYYLTQALSGHGSFGVYRAKRGFRPDSKCTFCGEEKDDAEHTLFECPANECERQRLTVELGLTRITKDNLILTMLTTQERWDDIATFIRGAMKTKEEKERETRRRD
ncbi:uncharacterized protein LOC131670344 [Phymastichus coffea]|uniref:uncharacterized protein LOC131670344 n=1 Tax=Phymastichus coffea TaxID=108790 RepID=UPI00273C0BE5|nr:uncharacterized protein LOC131670344 [Phymastichus coffea]